MTRADLRDTDLETARGLLAELFDAAFYRAETRAPAGDDAFARYWNEGGAMRPNLVFDPAFYLAQNPDAEGVNPLLHYAEIGEAAGRDPCALFDVVWYRRAYGAERPLAHYLAHRFGPFSPVPEFDAGFYLATYPDVSAARMDPFQHYMRFGYRDFRSPRAGFNPKRYANRHMGSERDKNPVAHLRAHGQAAAGAPAEPFASARAFAKPGIRHEPIAAPAAGEPRALALAFHLPQFHRIPENDAWWGEGFTEWTLLARGQPRFAGHYQPRIPGALGFYDLGAPEALAAQARLARAAGVGGFVFYHYDFGGRRLLEKPVELFLRQPDIDIGFCLMWANENWTRRWDGAEDEALIAQDYDPAHETARIADFARHFGDPRYIRLQGRPLLMIYRAGLIPDAGETLARWRRLFEERHGEQPLLVMAQTFDDLDPRPLGLDGAIEFPPHKLTRRTPQVFAALEPYDDALDADVFAYDDVVAASLTEAKPDYPLIKTAAPAWDNDARRQGRGLTLAGATPLRYERWLTELIAQARPFFGAQIVAINAWNEWSEGAYLEPDVHLGAACLNATARALYGLPPPPAAVAAKVSAFLLHGGGTFPPARLRSVFAQTLAPAEIVVLDTGEDCLETVEAEAQAAGRDVALGIGVGDGVAETAALASSEFVWLVDARGRSDARALALLTAALQAAPEAVCAICDSAPEGAAREAPNPLTPARRRIALADRVFDGAELLSRLIETPQAAAILWRRAALAGTGDLEARLRAACLAPGAQAAYVAETLDFSATA